MGEGLSGLLDLGDSKVTGEAATRRTVELWGICRNYDEPSAVGEGIDRRSKS